VIAIVLVLLCVSVFAVVRLGKLLVAAPEEKTVHTVTTPVQEIKALTQVTFDPRAGFPGKHRINVLVMGIDDNWTDQNVMYTKNARTDTLFLLSLDFDHKKSGMLSIPRDSYVPIAGTNYSDKINSAYASGGPERSVATFANLTGVWPNYYVVLNIDATKRLVDALGGVDVNVEHEMDYDDNWGHLHVHLKPGYQHLNGDQALSFVRYRHSNKGLAPEDGDPRRIYRQHVLMRAMIDKIKTFQSAINSALLVDTAMSCVSTNLSRTQIADLAHIYQGIKQDDIVTAQLDGSDARGANGAWLVMLDPQQVNDYINWMVKGDEPAVWSITPVEVKGGPRQEAAVNAIVTRLRAAGFSQASAIGANPNPGAPTTVIDTGVQDENAVNQIARILGLTNSSIVRNAAQPNHSGWTPPQKISILLGTGTQTASSQATPS
jgi:LCP family protein required for cell wall assembly